MDNEKGSQVPSLIPRQRLSLVPGEKGSLVAGERGSYVHRERPSLVFPVKDPLISQEKSLNLQETEIPTKDVQLRVIPAELRFLDTMMGKVYHLQFTIHNLGRWNQKFRFKQPFNRQFKLLIDNLDKELAAGLQMTATVEYRPIKDEDTYDELLISTGKKIIEVPLKGLIPHCDLNIGSEVNFGTLVADKKVHSRVISVINNGKASGTFQTEYTGELPILISPVSGNVKALSSENIKIDFLADQPGTVHEVAKMRLQGRPDAFFSIKAQVVMQNIEMLNISGEEKINHIQFGSTFFGTSKIEKALLYNNSPEPNSWVAIIQDGTVGEEMGTNIRQRTDMALNNLRHLNKIRNVDVTSFMSCVPNEGYLLPFQKTEIKFCFTPKLMDDTSKDMNPSHRQDYVIFLRFETIGSKEGILKDDDTTMNKNDQFQKLEIALSGTGLPVVLQFDTGKTITFPPCGIGNHSDVLCTIHNLCTVYPVPFRFKRQAQFKISPEKGTIEQGCEQRVIFTFTPHQLGSYKVKQAMEILGLVADENLQSMSMKPIHYIFLDFHSTCTTCAEKTAMEISPAEKGIMETFDEDEFYRPVALIESDKTDIHSNKVYPEAVSKELRAFPKDQPASFKKEQHKTFRNIFTRLPSRDDADPDFALTESEKLRKRENKDYYRKYFEYLRSARLGKQKKREFGYSENDPDIGLEPASGLRSPILSQAHIKEELPSPEKPKAIDRLLSTKDIAAKLAMALERKIFKGLTSMPLTLEEKEDCRLVLTSKEIHQVIIGPPVLDFGDVCVKSTNTLLLHIINLLSIHVFIRLDIDFLELRKTEQFSYVAPPSASSYASIIFESSVIGKFWKSFKFRVNNAPGGHILVKAVVKPLKLELSSNELKLTRHGFYLEGCFRDTVRLYNRLNSIAQFRWTQVTKEKESPFTIRPSKGIVEAYSSMECEVTWQPGFSSPERAEFMLLVFDGNVSTLKCVVDIGNTKVVFLEPRILFSNTPQGITTWRKAVLHNIGQNHAIFKVSENNLLPTIDIFPTQGIIPVGGLTVLNIASRPTMIANFDVKAKVAIRHANIVEFRVGGTVEVADIEIMPNVFDFKGTYVSSTKIIPFTVKNKGVARARVEFNLKGYEEFSMDFKDKSVKHSDPRFPYIYFLEVDGNESQECGLSFTPKYVKTYNFKFHVQINYMDASKNYLKAQLLNFPPIPKLEPLIPPCFVHVTVLTSPLKLSSTEFVFAIPAHIVEQTPKITRTQSFLLQNISKQSVRWTLDFSNTDKVFKKKIFQLSVKSGRLLPNERCKVSITFSPSEFKTYAVDIPMRLNKNPVCYKTLSITGEVILPNLTFNPSFVFFTPIPLDIKTVIDIRISPRNYYRNSNLKFQVITDKLLKNHETSPLSVIFPNGNTIKGSPRGVNHSLHCQILFSSSEPVSFFTRILFGDDHNNWFSLPVTGTAENCIITIYPFLATHMDEKIIGFKDEVKTKRRLTIQYPTLNQKTASHPESKTPASANKDLIIEIVLSDEDLKLDDDGVQKQDEERIIKEKNKKHFFYPEKGTKAYDFYQKIVKATETWFSVFGWPQGVHSLSIPETIRSDVCKVQHYSSSSKRVSRLDDFSKYNKTIYDVMVHLSGQWPPGINAGQDIPVDTTERLKQLYLQYSSLLLFLSNHGSYISCVQPEYLFEPEDYKKWMEMESLQEVPEHPRIPRMKNPHAVDPADFEGLSKWAWTEIFLQTYKAFILSRVLPLADDDIPPLHVNNTPKINPHFVSSNVYSTPERTLLSWMNTNYENTRRLVWENCRSGGIPAERWILNFDADLSDGLVLAAQIAAYCPFLIESHFVHMYTQPTIPEQYLNNALIIINVLHEIGFDMDIQANDICDPNPIQMLMLCVEMYERLPTYLPKEVVPFLCTLYETQKGQILLKNPSLKTLVYHPIIIGRDAANFSLCQTEDIFSIPAKDQITVYLTFKCYFLRPSEATLILIPKQKNEVGGVTMAFALRGEAVNFDTVDTIKCESPCYELKRLTLKIENHFQASGHFKISYIDSPLLPGEEPKFKEATPKTDLKKHRLSYVDSPMLSGAKPKLKEVSQKTDLKKHRLSYVDSPMLPSVKPKLKESTKKIDLMKHRLSYIDSPMLPSVNPKVKEASQKTDLKKHRPSYPKSQSLSSVKPKLKEAEKVTDLMKISDTKNMQENQVPGSYSEFRHVLKTSINCDYIKEFYCPTCSLYLEANEVTDLQVFFLPFNVHTNFCVIVLSNQKIGELVYFVEGTGLLPLPSKFIPSTCKHPLDFRSLPDKDSTTYLKCNARQTLSVELKLPLTNDARERALIFVAQQEMTELEYERRKITGTLESSSVRVAVAILGLTINEARKLFTISALKRPKFILYNTDLSLPKYFGIPEKVLIPQVPENPNKFRVGRPSENKVPFGYVPFPVKFFPHDTGSYPCRILLVSKYDIRSYYIEGIVNENEPEATVQFDTPAFKPLTQYFPLHNKTQKRWTYHINVQGDWFSGTSTLTVDAGQTMKYSVTFNPILECDVRGKVTITNELSGMEHTFDIRGIGRKPVALEHITVICEVGTSTTESIVLHNYTSSLLKYVVTTDLPMVSGDSKITLNPERESYYTMKIHALKHGIFKGTISFTAEYRPNCGFEKIKEEPSIEQPHTDDSQNPEDKNRGDDAKILKVWYTVEIKSSPTPPEKIIDVNCIALESVVIEMPLHNPTQERRIIAVQLTSDAFRGLDRIILNPLGEGNYLATYTSAFAGCKDERIFFQPENAQEFSYLLKIKSELPKPVVMPEIKCMLGTSAIQIISLNNPTHETLKLEATNSNPRHFILDPSEVPPWTVDPHSTTEVAVKFRPSALGRKDHQGSITFHCAQFSKWEFSLSGVGLFPQPSETRRVTSLLRDESPIIITFHNPTTEDVIINIKLTNQEPPTDVLLDQCWDSFLVKHSFFKFGAESKTEGISLKPQGIIKIPVYFGPEKMSVYKTIIVVQMMKSNAEMWPVDNFSELDTETKRMMRLDCGEINSIHWLFPVLGFPQAPQGNFTPVLLRCQAKKQVHKRVKLNLKGDFYGPDPPPKEKDFVVSSKMTEEIILLYNEIYEGMRIFEYDFELEPAMTTSNLEDCLRVFLVRARRFIKNQMIKMVFDMTFTPQKPMKHHMTLKIECIQDGIWRFPFILHATNPDLEDVINIRAIGLLKESVIDMRLTSQTSNPEPFTAYFEPGSDPEFFVRPSIGELPASEETGIIIKVGFKPKTYSRPYKAHLVIETADLYRIYEVNGYPPCPLPLHKVQAKIDAPNRKLDEKPTLKRNFLQENVKIPKTGVSSPLKDGPEASKK